MFLKVTLSFLLVYTIKSIQTDQSNDGNLFLTPYIESNQLNEAINASKVNSLPNSPSFESYSGFLTVDKKYNSNLFFWFFPSKKNARTAPVLVYLEGGPGASSIFSVFGYGPLKVDKDLNVSLRPFGWTEEFSVLYIDNPVGTGYSFTDDERGLSKDQNSVADNLYTFLQQFFQIYSDYRDNDLYVTGESYGGKYAPALGYKLMQMANESRMNFKGIIMADGLTDPLHQLNYADTLKSMGLVDLKQYESVKKEEEDIRSEIRAENWSKATDLFFKLMFTNLNVQTSLISNYTGYMQYYDIRYSGAMTDVYEMVNFPRYLALESAKQALHVGHRDFVFSNSSVATSLHQDFVKSVEPNFTALVTNKYKVLLITGNMDLTVGVGPTTGMLENKNWKHFQDYYDAERIIYKVSDSDPEVAGYVKTFGKFRHVIVRNAGHCAAADQPRVTLDTIKRFIYDKSFEN